MPKFFRKNHRSGYNRSGQSAATSFVNSSNASDADGAQFLFVTESAAPVHLIGRLHKFAQIKKLN